MPLLGQAVSWLCARNTCKFGLSAQLQEALNLLLGWIRMPDFLYSSAASAAAAALQHRNQKDGEAKLSE